MDESRFLEKGYDIVAAQNIDALVGLREDLLLNV